MWWLTFLSEPHQKPPQINLRGFLILLAGLLRRFFFSAFFARRLIDHLHGQAHLATVIKAQKFDPDILTFLQHIAWMVQAAAFNLADIDRPSLAKEIHEGTKIHDFDHFCCKSYLLLALPR